MSPFPWSYPKGNQSNNVLDLTTIPDDQRALELGASNQHSGSASGKATNAGYTKPKPSGASKTS